MTWQTKKLGELCGIRTGKKDVNEGNPNGEYPFFTCAREHTYSDVYSFDTEALLIAGNGDVGHVSYYKGKFEAYQRTYVLSDFQNILPRYLFMYLDGFLKDTVSRQKLGNTMPYIKMGMLTDFQVPLPEIDEQKQIVKKLDDVFEKVTKAKEATEKNLQNSKELFESYLQNVFSNPGTDWEEKKLSDVCEKITDGTHQTPTYFDEGYIFLSSRNVKSGKIDWENIKYIDKKQHLEMHKRVSPRTGDILLAKNGTTGVAAIVDKEVDFDIYVSLALLRVRDMITPSFMLYFINSPVAKKQFNKRLKGSGVPNLHLEEIREVIITFPKSISEQRAIVKKLDKISAETRKLEKIYEHKLADLEELKKSVLKKAFTGNI